MVNKTSTPHVGGLGLMICKTSIVFYTIKSAVFALLIAGLHWSWLICIELIVGVPRASGRLLQWASSRYSRHHLNLVPNGTRPDVFSQAFSPKRIGRQALENLRVPATNYHY
jgi:hypothetical protein